jgi:phosphohistidine phosphatase
MKTVYLFRHGDSEESGLELDYCRKLTEEGRLRTAEMSDHLKSEGIRTDLIVASEAVRAKSTACIAAERLDYPETDIVPEDILYSSKKPEEVMALLKNIPDKISSVMLVGHNPLLSDFALYISSRLVEVNMKKSSVLKIVFHTKEWDSITPGSGNIKFYKIFEGKRIIDAVDKIVSGH